MKSGQIVVGAVLVSVAAALAAYVANVAGATLTTSHDAQEATARRDALLELAGRLALPGTYAEVECPGDDDSRCWHTAGGGKQAAQDVRSALAAAGVDGLTVECRAMLDVPDASCTVQAPSGHDGLVTVLISPPVRQLTAGNLHDPAAIAAMGTDVTLLVPAG